MKPRDVARKTTARQASTWLLSGGVAVMALLAVTQVHAEGKPTGPQAAYAGVWGTDAKACRDPEGVEKMLVQGSTMSWYESDCRISGVKADGNGTWTMTASCEGEGRRFGSHPKVTLLAPDSLVMEGSPVGKEKRQTYVRCNQ